MDQRLRFERDHVPWGESQGQVEEDGVCTSTSEIVHPAISVVRIMESPSKVKIRNDDDSHLRSSSIDTMFPDQMISISINDRVSSVGSIKHLGRVEDE